VKELTRQNFEGKVEKGTDLIILAYNIKRVGDGRIVHGDGAVYQTVEFEALVFRPELNEVVSGTVNEIMKFGAFVRFGPLDGLLHISQVMDDRIEIDEVNERLIGKDTKRELKVGDVVKARIVTISINERSPRESKIGLTMRQPGLGKIQWIEEERRKQSAAAGGGPAPAAVGKKPARSSKKSEKKGSK
ncbi:MAG: DNA-directed RNA polymerase, partial [Thermoplasmata archaeon]